MDKILSLRDLGYKQAILGDDLETLAGYAIEHIVGFPDTIPPEAKAEIVSGYQLRKGELMGDNILAVIDGNYVKATDDMLKNKKVEKVNVNVAFAFAYTAQQFGKLKGENPALHAVVAKVRDQTQTYCSNKLGDLIRKAKMLLRVSDGKPARVELTFAESLTKMFDTQEKSCKVKQAKGDVLADVAKYKKAVDAFWSVLK